MIHDVIIFVPVSLSVCSMRAGSPFPGPGTCWYILDLKEHFLGCVVYNGFLDSFIASQKSSTLNHLEFTLSNGSVAKEQFLDREHHPLGTGTGLFCAWLFYVLLLCCS